VGYIICSNNAPPTKVENGAALWVGNMLIVSTQWLPYIHSGDGDGIYTLRSVSPVVGDRQLPCRTKEATVTVPFLTRMHHTSSVFPMSCIWGALGYGDGLVVAWWWWLQLRFRHSDPLHTRVAKACFAVLQV